VEWNKLTKCLVTEYIIKCWPADRIQFKNDNVNSPTFILISGSKNFLEETISWVEDAPTLLTYEVGFKPKLKIKGVFKVYSAFNNGSCLKCKIGIGFTNVQPPKLLVPIKRSLGDFLDFSIKPEILRELPKPDYNYLTKDSIYTLREISSKVILPTSIYLMGWGIRNLYKKEVCSIWGLSELNDQPVTVEDLIILSPVQPLGQVLHAFFCSKPLVKSFIQMAKKEEALPAFTRFDELNVEINHDWVDQSLISTSTRKEDKAPVPTALWDRRIIVSFCNNPNAGKLIEPLRSFLIRVYRRRLLKSFINYIGRKFPGK